jgi:hypothetical protein
MRFHDVKRYGALALMVGGLLLTGCGVEAEAPEADLPTQQEAALHRECPTPSEAERQQLESRLSAQAASTVRPIGSVSIPVYFHVINQGAGIENGDIPLTMIQEQVAVLNHAFRNTPFVFSLVKVDRTTNATWYKASQGSTAEMQMKTALRMSGKNALNVYSTSPGGGLLGWATFPWSYASNPFQDGVVVHHGTLPGGAAAPYNLGHNTTHEVGHWLGLYHVQNGCSKAENADDTPAAQYSALGCVAGLDTCPTYAGLDPIHNYMTLFEDSCMSEFTPNQAARMDSMAAQYR